MALVTSAQFQAPQRGQGIAGGIKTMQALTQAGLQREAIGRDEQIRQALSGATNPLTQQTQQLAEQSAGLGQDPAILSVDEMKQKALSIDPFIAKKHFEAIGIDSASKREEASRFAAKIQGLPIEMREQAINERIQSVQARGGDPKDSAELLDMNEQQQNQALTNIQLMDLSTKERFGVQAAAATATRATGPKIGIYNPRDYTVESFSEFRQTGDPSKLVRFKETQAVTREAELEAKLKLEKLSKEKRQKIALQKLKIDETRFKDDEERKQAVDAKEIRRNEADNAVDVINNLLKGDRFSAGFGRIATAIPEGFLPKETVDIKAEIAQVVNLIGLESRQKLKGQGTVSDSEANALAKSATTLANPLLSDDAARKELSRVRGIFEASSARNQLKKETKESEAEKSQVKPVSEMTTAEIKAELARQKGQQ